MLFANVCEGFISSRYGEYCNWRFLGFFGFFLVSCACGGVLVFLGSLLCTRIGLHRCASCWTRPLGGGRWRYYLCNLWGKYLKVVVGGLVRLRSRSGALPFGLPLGCLLSIRVGSPSRLRFKASGRFMMSVFSLCLGRMLHSWMMQVMSLVHGLSGLVLLRLRLLTLTSSVGVLFRLEVWFLGGRVLPPLMTPFSYHTHCFPVSFV